MQFFILLLSNQNFLSHILYEMKFAMDDKTKNRFESLAILWKGAWDQFNERRKYEFQISLAIWTALASFTGFILTSKEIAFDETVLYSAGGGFMAIFLVYFFWRHNLSIANQKDKEIAFHYERILQSMSDSEFSPTLKSYLASNKWVKKYPFLSWSPLSQIVVTALLCLAAFFAVKYKI